MLTGKIDTVSNPFVTSLQRSLTPATPPLQQECRRTNAERQHNTQPDRHQRKNRLLPVHLRAVGLQRSLPTPSQ